jgi:hypothetical protein
MIVCIENDNESISCGALKFILHLFIIMTRLYHNVTFLELPVINPTKYMFETYSHLGRDKWEVYSEVVRAIYCELRSFNKSTKTFDDMLNYLSEINGKRILNT